MPEDRKRLGVAIRSEDSGHGPLLVFEEDGNPHHLYFFADGDKTLELYFAWCKRFGYAPELTFDDTVAGEARAMVLNALAPHFPIEADSTIRTQRAIADLILRAAE